jgi:hypothetical protein
MNHIIDPDFDSIAIPSYNANDEKYFPKSIRQQMI